MFRPDPDSLRDEIAAVAARLIAEDGLDYAGAKQRALREVLGDRRQASGSGCMPDNAAVEAAVREYQGLFMAETQPARLASLRRTALGAMRFLAEFEPWLTGAVLNGTAGEHSDIHLQVFNDNAKDIEIHLLNAGVDFDVAGCDDHDPSGQAGEVLSFRWPPRSLFGRGPATPPETIHLAIVDPRQRHQSRAARTGERADLHKVDALVTARPDSNDQEAR